MVRIILLICISILELQTGISQILVKPVIDTSVIRSWPSLGGAKITHNGQYVLYNLYNIPFTDKTLIVQSFDGKRKREIPAVEIGSVSLLAHDSKFVFRKSKDTLGLFTFRSSKVEFISDIKSFKTPQNENGEWLAYLMKNNNLVVKNVQSGKSEIFEDIIDYFFDPKGKILLLKKACLVNPNSCLLICNDLESKKKTQIWQGFNANDLCFDESSSQLVFTTQIKVKKQILKSIWYYHMGDMHASILIDNSTIGFASGLPLASISEFSRDGRRLFVKLIERDTQNLKTSSLNLRVWSYRDLKLQSEQVESDYPKVFDALIDINSQKVVQLQVKNEFELSKCDEWSLYSQYIPEEYQPGLATIENLRNLYLVSRINGKRILIQKRIPNNSWVVSRISPDGKYVVYYDPDLKGFVAYDTKSATRINLTSKINTDFTVYIADKSGLAGMPYRIAAWIKENGIITSVLLNDQHDIWRISLLGIHQPRNVTNGYGKKNRILFEISDANGSDVFSSKQNIILNSFDRISKVNGFYMANLSKTLNPVLQTSGDFIYEVHDNYYFPEGSSFSPLKAKEAKRYLVRRMSAVSSPNYFTTSDFRTFIKMSKLSPESTVNWLRAELHTWKSSNGSNLQGVMYKPENFDSSKKYPIIFNYYERKSDGVNAFLIPECGPCQINIPTYVSSGYLVFTPDANFEIGSPGQGILSSVLSAVKYLANFPYIDTKKMGLQGCSFGGWETNYIVTHTDIFEAACTASGLSDFVSGYGSLGGSGASLQGMYELSYWRMGATLWDAPGRYIDNSPIFNLQYVQTPLLIMATTLDGVCPFPQNVELFTGLRRLQKKSWMLEYEDFDHGLTGKAAEDFSIRMKQFFDYYLKDFAPPEWMTKGRPSYLKATDDRLNLDTTGNLP